MKDGEDFGGHRIEDNDRAPTQVVSVGSRDSRSSYRLSYAYVIYNSVVFSNSVKYKNYYPTHAYYTPFPDYCPAGSSTPLHMERGASPASL